VTVKHSDKLTKEIERLGFDIAALERQAAEAEGDEADKLGGRLTAMSARLRQATAARDAALQQETAEAERKAASQLRREHAADVAATAAALQATQGEWDEITARFAAIDAEVLGLFERARQAERRASELGAKAQRYGLQQVRTQVTDKVRHYGALGKPYRLGVR